MKKKLFLFIIIALSFTILVGCGSNSRVDTADKKVLVVGVDDTFAPMTFREKGSEKLIGFDKDMGDEIARRLGIKIEWKSVDWKGIIPSLTSSKIDMVICGMTITPDRKEAINFSIPYMNAGISMASKFGINPNNYTDLNSHKIGVQTGSSGADALIAAGYKKPIYYDNYPLAFADLQSNRLDYVAVDTVVGGYYAKENPKTISLASKKFESEQYGIGMRKEDVALKTKIDKAINDMIGDGTLNKIGAKWFDENSVDLKTIIPQAKK